MALNIYKPGQGYWTRVLSAVGAGVLVLAGIAWLWNELEAVGSGATTVRRTSVEAVQLLNAWGAATSNPVASLGTIRRITTAGNPLTFTIADAAGKTYQLDALQFQAALNFILPGKASTRTESIARLPTGARVDQGHVVVELGPTFAHRNRIYIQSSVAVGLILVFGGLIYWLLNKPTIVDFMIATEAEMRKVNWPTRREIVGSTWIVICGTFLMAMLLLVVDVIFAELFIVTHVLQGESIFKSLYLRLFGG